MILRRNSGSIRKEVMGGWRKLLNEKLHNLSVSPDIIRVTKARKMRWQGMRHEWKR
jgi:hypothetical protein